MKYQDLDILKAGRVRGAVSFLENHKRGQNTVPPLSCHQAVERSSVHKLFLSRTKTGPQNVKETFSVLFPKYQTVNI